MMFLNVGVRLSNLRACKRTQAWAPGLALHAGARVRVRVRVRVLAALLSQAGVS